MSKRGRHRQQKRVHDSREKKAPLPRGVEQEDGLGHLTLLTTRRVFLKAISTVVLGAAGSITAYRVDQALDGARANEAAVNKFFFLFDTEKFSGAYNVGVDLAMKLPPDSEQYLRWLNNLACTLVWEGEFGTAWALLSQAAVQAKAQTWSKDLVRSNLAYVLYHLGKPTSGLISVLERNARLLASESFRGQPWLQLWSRQPAATGPLIPPFGVLWRLYAQAGDFQHALMAGTVDIDLQGRRAQGTRIGLGFIAHSMGRDSLGLRLVEEVQPEYNPPASWEHMKAERDVLISSFIKRSSPSEPSFLGQAASVKGQYYSWTSLANVRYLLASELSKDLCGEYGKRVIEGYKNEKGDLPALQQIMDIIH
jgi:hypothetical protein